MRAHRASDTALLIARSTLLLDATPSLAALPPKGSAVLTRQLLASAPRSRWFDFAVRYASTRAILFAAERLLLPGIFLHYFCRKRQLDQMTDEALAASCRQLVVLGAGLDTLAWRVQTAHSHVRCFELDHPATQAIKQRAYVSSNSPVPALLPADLTIASPAQLLRADSRFDCSLPTLFVAEGLFMYLTSARVSELLRDLSSLASSGSRLAFTFMESRPGRPLAFHNARRAVNLWLRWRGEEFRSGLQRHEVAEFSSSVGWCLARLSSPEELRTRFLTPLALTRAPLALGESIALCTKFT